MLFTVEFDANELPGFEPEIFPVELTDPNNLYVAFSHVVMNVTPPPVGYEVVWTGADKEKRNEPNNWVTMDGNQVVKARYSKISYRLNLKVLGGGKVSIIEPYDPDNKYLDFMPYTTVKMEADPDPGYRLRRWYGTNNDPNWGNLYNTVLMDSDKDVTVEFELDTDQKILVPRQFKTLDEAFAVASSGDEIIVEPGVYTINNPEGLDFLGRDMKLISAGPDDPNYFEAAIIDLRSSGRAFHFHSGEGADSVVMGFTIINGMDVGEPITVGSILGVESKPEDQHGYGGAIFCENASSPTIRNCRMIDNRAIGANGLKGYDGYSPGTL